METPESAQYPSYRYHRSGATRVVQDHAEHTALQDEGDWAHTPAAFPPVPESASCATCGRPFAAPDAQTEDATAAADASEPTKSKSKKAK